MPATYTYKVLGQTAASSTAVASLYTAPASTQAVVSTITVCNISASTASYRIAVKPTAATSVTNTHYVVYDAPILANDTVTLTLGITLAATNNIEIKANTANALTFAAFGAEIA